MQNIMLIFISSEDHECKIRKQIVLKVIVRAGIIFINHCSI